jgi:hypothetical protein
MSKKIRPARKDGSLGELWTCLREAASAKAGPIFIIPSKLRRSNRGKFVGLLRGQVAPPIMPGIPKFRKESHPERAKNSRRPIFSHLLTLPWKLI